MKVIIDFIEDVRESIANSEDFVLTAMLVKKDETDSTKLVYAGESPLHAFEIDEKSQRLLFSIHASGKALSMGEVIPSVLILGMDRMMYALKIDVNAEHKDIEVIGFGKNEEEKKYILFISI